jgi:hypothetical protein
MSLAYVAGGQLGSDGTGNFSQSFAEGVCNGALVFIVSNASNAAPVSGNVTYNGVAMTFVGSAIDAATELGRVDCYFLGGASFPSGTQTVAFTQSGGATKRLYAVSFSCAAGKVIQLYKNNLVAGVDDLPTNPQAAGTISAAEFNKFYGYAKLNDNVANPSVTLAVPASRTVAGAACLFTGNVAASTSVANGTERAEANFSGNAKAASLLTAAPVNNGNLVMGWTVSTDDMAAIFAFIEECDVLSGNVTLDGVAQAGAKVLVVMATDNSLSNAAVRAVATTDGSGDWSADVPVGMVSYAHCMWDDSGTLYSSVGAPFLSP